ncbi:MAG: hypothetical protein K1W23_15755 [Lachnospiraceae bacterium]|jgi:hypothetical protein
MTRKRSRIIAVIMLITAAVFIVIALNNPQAVFPWSNTITYSLYGIYAVVMTVMFIAPFRRNR